MPRIDIDAAPEGSGSRYPEPYNQPCIGRRWKRLGDAAGLIQFGVNLLWLDPGVWSSQRHWHTHEDEFLMVLEGEVIMVTDAGEEILRAGDCAGFPANSGDGHRLENRTQTTARILVAGSRSDEDAAHYPNIDMHARAGRYSGRASPVFVRKDGSQF